MKGPVIFGIAALLTSVGLWIAVGGCTHNAVTTMTGTFTTCAKADLGQIVASTGLPLLNDVADLIEHNAVALEADLTALATIVGIDAVKCAIEAVAAVLWPQPVATDAGPGSASTAMKSAPPGVTRALNWISNQEKKP